MRFLRYMISNLLAEYKMRVISKFNAKIDVLMKKDAALLESSISETMAVQTHDIDTIKYIIIRADNSTGCQPNSLKVLLFFFDC